MPAPHHRMPDPYNQLATGHATADRVAAGVISLTGGRTEKETPDFLGRCGPGRLFEQCLFRKIDQG